MFIKTLGQEYVCAEVHLATPELRQLLALNLNVLDVLRVFGRFDWRNSFVELYCDAVVFGWINPNLLRSAVQITGSTIPLLSFATVHRQLHRVSILAMKRFVHVEQS